MSRKSRQPDEGSKKKKRGRRNKGGDEESTGRAQMVVETRPPGVPFAVIVLVAAAMSSPSISLFLADGLRFDALMVRVFAALAVSWLLANLVWAVFDSMRPPETKALVELPPDQAFEALTAGRNNGGDDLTADFGQGEPFALDPVEPLEVEPPAPAVAEENPEEKGKPAA